MNKVVEDVSDHVLKSLQLFEFEQNGASGRVQNTLVHLLRYSCRKVVPKTAMS